MNLFVILNGVDYMKAIVCKNVKKDDRQIIEQVLEKLKSFGLDAAFSPQVHNDCDVIITVGGDGTILHHGKKAAEINKPLLGINTGKLGFMTSLETNELDLLEKLTTAENHIFPRMMLDVIIGGACFSALNDAVFYKDVTAKLPEFKLSVNGNSVSEIRADGLIMSTPTGSTAYALSAGGPIIEPFLDCVLFTPLCAHSLFGRPMIFGGEHELTVEFSGEPDTVSVSVDGETGRALKRGEKAVIRKSDLRLSLIDIKGNSFYNAVNNKLIRPLK
ncbi:MAG: NAD(+)/NADH kinase [Oscillospiraceae bacterium]|nr:NAD(+)/NADH kinase [Oscillospiraceae bacterium]